MVDHHGALGSSKQLVIVVSSHCFGYNQIAVVGFGYCIIYHIHEIIRLVQL